MHWLKRIFKRADSGPNAPGTTAGQPAAAKPWFVSRRDPRDHQIAALQAGYNELLGLVRAIREHLDRQSPAQERVLQALDHLPDAMAGFKDVGAAAGRQTELLGLIRDEMEKTAKRDERTNGTLQQFNETLFAMDQTCRKSIETIAELAARSRGAEKSLYDMMDRSERRVAFMSTLLALFIAAAGGLAVYIFWPQIKVWHAGVRAPAETAFPAAAPALLPLPEFRPLPAPAVTAGDTNPVPAAAPHAAGAPDGFNWPAPATNS